MIASFVVVFSSGCKLVIASKLSRVVLVVVVVELSIVEYSCSTSSSSNFNWVSVLGRVHSPASFTKTVKRKDRGYTYK